MMPPWPNLLCERGVVIFAIVALYKLDSEYQNILHWRMLLSLSPCASVSLYFSLTLSPLSYCYESLRQLTVIHHSCYTPQPAHSSLCVFGPLCL